MHILVAYRGLPWPITEGYHLRVIHIFKRLRAAGHQVHLLGLINSASQRTQLGDLESADLFDSISLMDFPSRSWAGRVKTNLGFDPAASLLAEYPGFSGQIRRRVAQLSEQHQLDVAYVFDPWAEVLFCEARHELPTLLDVCDSRSLFYQRQLEVGKVTGLARLRLRQLHRRFCGLEAFALANYPLTTAVSPDDRHALMELWPRARVEVVANGVDLNQFSPHQGTEAVAGRILMFGNMDFSPNVDAAVRCARELLPLIKRRAPQAHLVVVGTNPVPAVLALDDLDGVEVTGEVEDLPPWISSSCLLLAPMRFGAGIKNKVLETMACARPVVTTNLAATALHPDAAGLLVLADGNQELADAVVKLLHDPTRALDLGVRGREVMRRHHSWEAAAARYGELLAELTAR